jgi:hypothetical protein
MASRLYHTTQQLYRHVEGSLLLLGVGLLGSPTLVVLIALYVTGLILLDARPTQTHVVRFLPGRCHDALNRLLRCMPWSTRVLMGRLIALAKGLGLPGYLCLDEVVIEKAFAKRLPWAGWTYSSAQKRQVYGLLIVVLLWCSQDEHWRIPVGFRLWRPQRSCQTHPYRTRLELAEELVVAVVTAGLPAQYIVFDTHYTAGWFTKRLNRLGLTWHGTLDPRTSLVWQGRRQAVSDLAASLQLKWRDALELRAKTLRVYAPKYGQLRLVVTRNRHGNYDYLVSNDLKLDLTTMVLRKRSRWSIETIFRDSKQFAGLEACQCWVDQAMVRHIALVLLTFVVIQRLRASPTESVGQAKERWQLTIFRNGQLPPLPLRACPPQFRATA